MFNLTHHKNRNQSNKKQIEMHEIKQKSNRYQIEIKYKLNINQI